MEFCQSEKVGTLHRENSEFRCSFLQTGKKRELKNLFTQAVYFKHGDKFEGIYLDCGRMLLQPFGFSSKFSEFGNSNILVMEWVIPPVSIVFVFAV